MHDRPLRKHGRRPSAILGLAPARGEVIHHAERGRLREARRLLPRPRRTTWRRRRPQDDLILYDSKDLVDARRLRRHDRQRQDRPLPRRCSKRRRSTASRRSSSTPRATSRNLLLTFPEPRAGGLRAVGRTRTTRARKGIAPDEFAAQQAETLEEGPGRAGARTARASRACATRPTSRSTRPAATPGMPLSILQLVRRAAGRPSRDDAELLRERVGTTATEPARPARHRRRPDPEPRAHPARRPSSTPRGAQGREPRPGRR